MRIITLILELAMLSLCHSTFGSPIVVNIPRDLDSNQREPESNQRELDSSRQEFDRILQDPDNNKRDLDSSQYSEQLDPGDSMNELASSETPVPDSKPGH